MHHRLWVLLIRLGIQGFLHLQILRPQLRGLPRGNKEPLLVHANDFWLRLGGVWRLKEVASPWHNQKSTSVLIPCRFWYSRTIPRGYGAKHSLLQGKLTLQSRCRSSQKQIPLHGTYAQESVYRSVGWEHSALPLQILFPGAEKIQITQLLTVGKGGQHWILYGSSSSPVLIKWWNRQSCSHFTSGNITVTVMVTVTMSLPWAAQKKGNGGPEEEACNAGLVPCPQPPPVLGWGDIGLVACLLSCGKQNGQWKAKLPTQMRLVIQYRCLIALEGLVFSA